LDDPNGKATAKAALWLVDGLHPTLRKKTAMWLKKSGGIEADFSAATLTVRL
jgi:hypothetical protein